MSAVDEKQAIEEQVMTNRSDQEGPETRDEGRDDVEVARAQIEQTRDEMSETIDAIEEKLAVERLRRRVTNTLRGMTIGTAQQMAERARTQAKGTAPALLGRVRQHPRDAALAGIGLAGVAMLAVLRPRKHDSEEPTTTEHTSTGESSKPWQSRSRRSSEGKSQRMAQSTIGNLARQSRNTVRTGTSQMSGVVGRASRRRKKLGRGRQAVGQVQQRTDENRLTIVGLMLGAGLMVAGRLLDQRRMQRRPARKTVRSPLLPAAAAVSMAALGIWLLRRRKGMRRTMTGQDLLLAWLNDAYSMETSLVQTLQSHARDAQEYPEIQVRLQQHLEQTRRHADLVQSCIERLGGKASSRKRVAGAILGKVQGLFTHPAPDRLVKNALAEAAAEHFEVAAYTALVVAADALGDQETVSICQQILQEDEEMAQWLRQHLPMVTHETLNALTSTTG